MPRLWDHSIDLHRDAVRGAIMDAAWTLAAERGPTGVTMAGVARAAGIGRATLYRYFADPEAILLAWHERQVAEHLARLDALARGPGAALDRLEAVLAAWGGILRRGGVHEPGLDRLVHRAPGTAQAHQALAVLVAGLLAEAAGDGTARTDAAPEELAAFCLHAMGAAGALPDAAAGRLAAVAVAGVRRPGDASPFSAS